MTLEGVRDFLDRRPFEPFRIHLSSGQTLDVRHPDQAMPLKYGLIVGLPAAGERVPERFTVCSYLHIAALEGLGLPQQAA